MTADGEATGDAAPGDPGAAEGGTGLLGVGEPHDAATTVLVAAFAVLLGLYAAWLVADAMPRVLGFLAVGGLGGVALYDQPTRAAVVQRGLYGLAAVVLATPLALDATLLVAAAGRSAVAPGAFVVTTATLVYYAVFAVLAAIPAVLGYVVGWAYR